MIWRVVGIVGVFLGLVIVFLSWDARGPRTAPATASEPMAKVNAEPAKIETAGAVPEAEPVVTEGTASVFDFGSGVLSNQSLLCREPQVVDASCGDGGRGAMSTAELEALAEQGDAIALQYLAIRSQRDPHKALALAHRAVVRGYVASLSYMSYLLTQAAEQEPGATRNALAEDAYVHAIAGIMFGFGHFRVNVIGTHIEQFPDVPVSARVCDAAARLVERINAERTTLGYQPLTVYQDQDAVRTMLQDDNGYCR